MKEDLAGDWKRIGAASVASAMFLLTLSVILGPVGARGLPLVGGICGGPLFQQSSEGQPTVQARTLHCKKPYCVGFLPVYFSFTILALIGP